MGRFMHLQDDVFSIFASQEWKSEAVLTRPSNFVSANNDKEFIRINILAESFGVNLLSVAGVLLIEIFIPVGSGSTRASQIADALDKYLLGKSVKTSSDNVTQFTQSTLVPKGKDKDDPSIFLYEYEIPFNYYGVH